MTLGDSLRAFIARISPILAALYLAVLFWALLYPFEFSSPFVMRQNGVAWPGDARGARFDGSGLLISAAPPTALFRRLTSGSGLSVELWLASASADQEGPARILTYSLNPWERNVTLAQQGTDLVVRLRTTETNANGLPAVFVSGALVPGKLRHVVLTYDFKEERVYVDGKRRVTKTRPRGSFATWDPSYLLALGNEASGGRPWNGTIAYAAIYDTPLSDAAVDARYQAGSRPGASSAPAAPVAAYDLTRGSQGLASSGVLAPMPRLEKPPQIRAYSRLFFLYIDGKMHFHVTFPWDLIRNVILFLPFGVFGVAVAGRRTRSVPAAILLTVVAATVVSAGCELLQYFEDARTSSILDVFTNALGALLGALAYRGWQRFDRACDIRGPGRERYSQR